MAKQTASVYRFRGSAAVYIGNGETAYIPPKVARKIARALNACAKDIGKVPFVKSLLPSVDVEWEKD